MIYNGNFQGTDKSSHITYEINAAFLSQANSNAENPKLISAMLCAALYPNVVQVTKCFPWILPQPVSLAAKDIS